MFVAADEAKAMLDSTQPSELPPAGWYPDPDGSGLRWWDGERWDRRLRVPSSPDEEQRADGGTGDPYRHRKIQEQLDWDLARSKILSAAPVTPPKQPSTTGAKILAWIALLAVVGVVASVAGIGGRSSSPVTVVGHSCTPNGDGSVHVQGRLKNTSNSSKATIVEFTLTLWGGQTETSRPFGGYAVPGGQTSLVGEDLNVPPGAEWVDCSVKVAG